MYELANRNFGTKHEHNYQTERHFVSKVTVCNLLRVPNLLPS